MADPADRADQEAETHLNRAREYRRPEGPKATGKCLCCNAQLPPGMRWCDKLCRDDWEMDEKLKAIGG